MSNWKYVQVDIPKKLYDRIARFSDVGEAILQDMTEWVTIMEDEERLAEIENSKIRFQVSKKNLNEYGGFHYEVIALKEKDKEDDFVGEFEGITSNLALLRIAKDGYGISSSEIQFI